MPVLASESGAMVVPGELLAVLSSSDDACMAGEGTYVGPCVLDGSADEGKGVYSTLVGKVAISSEGKVSVQRCGSQAIAAEAYAIPRLHSIVLAKVTSVREIATECRIECVGTVPVKRGKSFKGVLRREFVLGEAETEKVVMHNCFRLGDVIRAVVINLGGASGSYELSTAKDTLGVINAVCRDSGECMVPASWKEMQCPVTGAKEPRKVARRGK